MSSSQMTDEVELLKKLINSKDFQKAYEYGQQLMKNSKTNREVLNLLAYSMQQIEGSQKAFEFLKQNLDNSKQSILTLFHLGTLALELKQYQESLQFYMKIDQMFKGIPDVYFQIGYCHELLNDLENSLVYYNQCLKFKETSKEVYKQALINLSAIYIRKNELQKAYDLLKNYLKGNEDDQKAISNFLIVLYSDIDKQKELEEYQYETKDQQIQIFKLYNESIYQYKQGNQKESLNMFQQIVQEFKGVNQQLEIMSYVNMGIINEFQNQYEKANEIYQIIIESFQQIDKTQFENRIAANEKIIRGVDKSMSQKSNQQQENMSRQSNKEQETENENENYNKSSIQIKINELENEKKLFDEYKKNQQVKIEQELLQIQELKLKLAEKTRQNEEESQQKSNKTNEREKKDIDNQIQNLVDLNNNNSDDTLISIQKKVQQANSIKENQNQRSIENNQDAEIIQNQQILSRQLSVPKFQNWDEDHCKQILEEDKNNFFAYYQLAILNFQKQNLSQTKEYLMKVYEIKPDFNIEKINKGLAEIYDNEKNYSQAIKHYKNAYIYSKDKQDLMIKIGKCYEKLQQDEFIINSYETAILLNNKNYIPYFRLGCYYLKQQEVKKAIDNLQKASSLNNKNIQVTQKLADAYLLENNDESANNGALASLKIVLEQDPENYDALIGMGKLQEKMNNLDSAIKYIEQACSITGNTSNSLFYLGILHMRNKNMKKALELLLQLLQKNPSHIQSLVEIATIYLIQQEIDQSLAYFQKALKIDSNNLIGNLRIGKLYHIHFKNYKKAISHYQVVIEQDSRQFKALFLIGVCYQELIQIQQAQEHFKQSLKINPVYAPAWKQIGDLLYDDGNIVNAAKYYKKSLEYDENNIECKMTLANCEYMQENYNSAVKIYEEIVQLDQKQDDIYYNLANSYYMLQDINNAIKNYKQALLINKNNSEYFYNLGNAYCIQEQFQLAIEAFENSIAIDNNNASAFYNLGNTYLIQNEYDLAVHNFEQALKLSKGQNKDWLSYIGNIYFKKKDYQNTERLFDQLLVLDSKNIEARTVLKEIYQQQGLVDKMQKQQTIINEINEQNSNLLQVN